MSRAIGELSRAAEESGAARERARWFDERQELIAALNGAVGLLQLLRPRIDSTDGYSAYENHRYRAALAVLAKHEPAKGKA